MANSSLQAYAYASRDIATQPWRQTNALSMLESTLETILSSTKSIGSSRSERTRSHVATTAQNNSRHRAHLPITETTRQPTTQQQEGLCLQLVDLYKNYGKQASLQGLSLNLPTGCIYGLLGPNGAGKSTTMKIIATLLSPDRGSVLIGGLDVLRHPRLARTRLGYVGQDCALDKILTGREHLIFQADLHHLSDSEIKQRCNELIWQFNMSNWIDNRCGTYSGGMRRRLELACGLIHKPQLLILDEPTVGLDIESRSTIWQAVADLRDQGTSVLLSTHYLEEVEALADQVGIIDQGRMIAEGNPNELKKSLGGDRISLRIHEFTPRNIAEEAAQLLRRCNGIRSLVVDADQGNGLHAVIEHADIIPMIRTCLSEAGLPLFSLSHAQASLGDLYLQATGRSISDADQSASANRDLKRERRRAMR